MFPKILMAMALVSAAAVATPALAKERREGGKLLLTAGVSSVEGAAGGGLASWALIAGDETEDGIGGRAHVTVVPLADYTLLSYGGAIGINDRIEFSYAHQTFSTLKIGQALGLGHGFKFSQDVFGAKLRVLGDAVYGQDSWLPQIAIGVQHKRAAQSAIIGAVGGKAAAGTDFYVAATKAILSQSLVVDATVRFTKANQFGLLGFGGDKSNNYSAQFEGSAGMLLTRRLLVGGEVRTKPSNLGFAREDAAYDIFAAWAVQRHVQLTAAYVDLGSIATAKGQRGAFLSIQTSF
ncbi:MAG: DUF3034 family protein [Sphingomonas sp.]